MVSVPRLSLLGLLAVVGLGSAAVFHGVAVAPNTNHAWVVTSGEPAVYHTSDLGITWELQQANEYREYYDVFSFDSLTCWTCGKAGAVWHTTDGGDSWYRQNIGGPKRATRVRFFNGELGLVTGTWSFWLNTSSGGDTWSTHMMEREAESI